MKKLRLLLFGIVAAMMVASCSKNDPPLPDNTVNFQSSSLGFDDGETSKDVTVTLDRAYSSDITVSIQLTDSLVTYGTEYTTEPAANNNVISLTIPANATTASFKVKKADGIFLTGQEKIKFAIQSATTPVLTGKSSTLSLSFSSIVSDGEQMELDGGGSTYPNTVFVSFRTNTQTAVQRDIWNLALSNDNQNHILINSSMGMSAYAISKTDIDAVGQADFDAENVGKKALVGIPSTAALDAGFYPKNYIDNPYNPFTKGSAIAPVSTNDADNKVYIVGIGPAIGSPAYPPPPTTWMKVRITATPDGYSVDYAALTAITHKTVTVTKKQDDVFSYVSFNTNNVVNVEPAGSNWDIAWSYGIDLTPYKSSVSGISDSIPYLYQDLVYSNIYNNAKVASVDTTKISYTNFSESDISSLTFNNDNRLFIGPNWRNTASSGGIFRNIFYVVQDAYGNVYKLRFVSMGVGSDGGTRGNPVIEYKLVKKA